MYTIWMNKDDTFIFVGKGPFLFVLFIKTDHFEEGCVLTRSEGYDNSLLLLYKEMKPAYRIQHPWQWKMKSAKKFVDWC